MHKWIVPLRAHLGWALLAVGCGESQPPATPSAPGGALYALSSVVNDPGGQGKTSYLVLTDSLDAGAEIDYSQAIEIPDFAFLFGIPERGSFFTLQREAPVVTRYDVDERGQVIPGPQLSFANYGVASASTARSLHFVSETKAYLLDDTTLQAIVFNPEEMVIVGDPIPLGSTRQDGFTAFFDYIPKRRGNQLVVPTYHMDANFANVLPTISVVLLDVETDEVKVITDDRCGGLSNSVIAPNGDLYLGNEPYVGVLHRLGGDAVTAPCVLRIKAGEDSFDPTYQMKVLDVTEGAPGGGVAPGPGTTAYLRVYDESIIPITEESDPYTMLAAGAWIWKQVDLVDPTRAAKPVDGFTPGSGELQYYVAEGRAYVADTNADFSKSVLLDMAAADGPRKSITIRGRLEGLVRVR